MYTWWPVNTSSPITMRSWPTMPLPLPIRQRLPIVTTSWSSTCCGDTPADLVGRRECHTGGLLRVHDHRRLATAAVPDPVADRRFAAGAGSRDDRRERHLTRAVEVARRRLQPDGGAFGVEEVGEHAHELGVLRQLSHEIARQRVAD